MATGSEGQNVTAPMAQGHSLSVLLEIQNSLLCVRQVLLTEKLDQPMGLENGRPQVAQNPPSYHSVLNGANPSRVLIGAVGERRGPADRPTATENTALKRPVIIFQPNECHFGVSTTLLLFCFFSFATYCCSKHNTF